MELTTHAAKVSAAQGALPRELAEPLVLMVAPLAPHVAEELWQRLGHEESLLYADFPEADPALAAERTVTLPVQVNGKTRFTVEVPAQAGRDEIERVLADAPGYRVHTAGLAVERMIIVPGKIINIVTR
jgi:leucyl-tRNA synthetase